MKKRSVFCIIAAIIALLALFVLTLYLIFSSPDALFTGKLTAAQSDADAAIAALHEAETASHVKNAAFESDEIQLIWVGDSRTLGMQAALNNEDIYIGASGEGYCWFKESGLSILEEAIEKNPLFPVVFNFGVNDYDNLDSYLSLYGEIVSGYPDTHFYFLSVNPVDPVSCKNITNEEISDFNAHLQEAYPDTYLDSYTNLMASETATIDGIHYSKEGYQQIYEYAVLQIIQKEQNFQAYYARCFCSYS